MSVSLSQSLEVLAPGSAYRVRDDGSGPYIESWSGPGDQPTAEQIAAVTAEQVAAARQAKVDAAALTLLSDSGQPIRQATAASDAVGYELRNDTAEFLGALVRVLADRLSVAEATLLAEIEAEIAAGRVGVSYTETPPTAGTVVDRGRRRVQGLELLQQIGSYVGQV